MPDREQGRGRESTSKRRRVLEREGVSVGLWGLSTAREEDEEGRETKEREKDFISI